MITAAPARLAITLATRVFEPEGTAAAYRLGNLVRALESEGHTVTVLTSRAPAARSSTKRVRRWPVLRDSTGSVRGYVPYLSFDIPLFFRLLFGPRADIVVVEPPPTTGLVARMACFVRRTPYVYFSADVLSSAVRGIGVNRFVVAAVTWLERRAVRGAVGVLAVTEEVKRQVVALGASSANVALIGTGIDTDQFTVAGEVAQPGAPYFIYAGTMSEVHGAGVFFDAFERVANSHPDVQLRVFGSGVEVEELRARATPLGERVVFSSLVDATVLAPWIRGAVASLASVRPHRSYDFAFATKALASLACGTPVIYSGVGPLGPLVVEHRLGWATEWEPDTVADAMLDALSGSLPRSSERLAAWVDERHSLRAVAARAATAIREWAAGEGGAGELD